MKHLIALAVFGTFASFAAAQTMPPQGLTQSPPLAEYIDAFPRLTATDPAAQKVNSVLAELDTVEVQALQDCDGHRSISIALHTPAFLSLTVSRDGYCEGAAHPFHGQQAMTFDLASGAMADWQDLLPKALLDPDAETYDENYPLRSKALEAAYLTALTDPQPDCAEAYAQPLDFDFWLDADQQALALAPTNLAYAETACAETAYLPVKDLQAMAADSRLIRALMAARP